jgi:hypothetical protein
MDGEPMKWQVTKTQKIAILVIICLALGYSMAGGGDELIPRPPRRNERPFMKWIIKAARSSLWLMWLAESPTLDLNEKHFVTQPTTADADGYRSLRHGEGW